MWSLGNEEGRVTIGLRLFRAGVFFGASAVLIGGCSFGGTSFESPINKKKAAPIESSEVQAPEPGSLSARPVESPLPEITDIEVIWEVPSEPVDGFIVRYGNAREALSVEKRVRVDELQKLDDSERGPVYRYLIRGIPSTERIFLTVTAFKGDAISVPTRVFEIIPGVPS